MESSNNFFKKDVNNKKGNKNNMNSLNLYSVPSGMTSISTDRSLVLVRELKNFIGVEELHCHRSQTTDTVNFIEEHWSSEIKNLSNKKPPKFKKIIQAYRVLASDKLNLFVEVESDPPALFEWTINDKNIVYKQDDKIVCIHGLNLSQIIVKEPVEGIYSCKASNGYGISRSYGYVKVDNDIQKHKKFSSNLKSIDKSLLDENLRNEKDKKNLPYFINQVPNLIVDLGSEAVFDVEVDSPTSVQFFWFHNNKQFDENNSNYEFYYPSKNRCLVLIKMPEAGIYKVIARNDVGEVESAGYLSISPDKKYTEQNISRNLFYDPLVTSELTKKSFNDKNYKSLPRNIHSKNTNNSTLFYVNNFDDKQKFQSNTLEKVSNNNFENSNVLNEDNNKISNINAFTPIQIQEIENKRWITKNIAQPLPQKPIVDINDLSIPPPEIHVSLGQSLSLEMKVQSSPSSAFKWYHKNFEVKPSPIISIEKVAENHSKAIFKKPYSGIYKCVASNPHGEAVIETRVTSEYIEEVEIGRLINNRINNSNINLNSFVKVNKNIKKKNLPMAPKIIKKFENLLKVNENDRIELFVEVESIPPATFVWRHRHFELKSSKNVIIQNNDNKSKLILLKPQEGIYEVTAINEIGEDKGSCKIFVIYNTEKNVEEFNSKKNDEICHIKNIDNICNNKNNQSNSINEISLVVEIDNKINTKKSINNQNIIPLRTLENATFNMKKNVIDDELNNIIYQPYFINTLGIIKVNEGDKLICDAILNKEAGDKCIFIWFLNGNPIPSLFSNSYYDNGQKSKLCIPLMTKDMEGELLVIAENVKGVAEMKGEIIVENNEINKEILINNEKKDNKKSVEEVMADCIIQNIPQFRKHEDFCTSNNSNKSISIINNFKPKNDITEIKKKPESYKLLVKVAESIATTLVAKIFVEAIKESSIILAEQKRKCLLKEEGDFDDSILKDNREKDSKNIKNSKAPYFEITKEQYTVSEGQNITIHTVVHGFPPPNVLWYFENIELKSSVDGKYCIINTSGHSQLTIKNVERNKNSGNYYCKAFNKFGKAFYTCNLIIIEKMYETEIHNITTQVDVPTLLKFESSGEDKDKKSEHIEFNVDNLDHKNEQYKFIGNNLDDSITNDNNDSLYNTQNNYIELQKNNGESKNGNNKFNLPVINIHETDDNEVTIFHDVTLRCNECNDKVGVILNIYNTIIFPLSFTITNINNDKDKNLVNNIENTDKISNIKPSIISSKSQENSSNETSFVTAMEEVSNIFENDEKMEKNKFLDNNLHDYDSSKDFDNIQENESQIPKTLSKISNLECSQTIDHITENTIDLNFTNKNLCESNESKNHTISSSTVLEKEEEYEEIKVNIVDKNYISFISPSIHEILMMEMMKKDNSKKLVEELLVKLPDANNINNITNINIVRPEEKFEYVLSISEIAIEKCVGIFEALPILKELSDVKESENTIIKNDKEEKEEICTIVVRIHKPDEELFYNVTIMPNTTETSNIINLNNSFDDNYITNTKYMEMIFKEHDIDETITKDENNKKHGTFKITNTSVLGVFTKKQPFESSEEIIIKEFDKKSSCLNNVKQINFVTFTLPQKQQIITSDQNNKFVTKIDDTIVEENFTIDITKNNTFDYQLIIVDMEQTTFEIECTIKLMKSKEISDTFVHDEFVNVECDEKCDIKILEIPVNLTKLNYIWMQSHSENEKSAQDVWLQTKTKNKIINDNDDDDVRKYHPNEIFNEVLSNISSYSEDKKNKNCNDSEKSLSMETTESHPSYERPVFINLLKDIEKNIGDCLNLKVIVLGNPLPNIIWKFNDKNINEENENIKIICEDGISILSLKNINKCNEGYYKAIAINNYGISETKCYLKISG